MVPYIAMALIYIVIVLPDNPACKNHGKEPEEE